jgi:hypothetical protein
MTILSRVGLVIAFLLGLFFIVRAIVELVTIDYSDPTSYAADWGGPSLGRVARALRPGSPLGRRDRRLPLATFL